jgi:hypothetical protein
VTDDGFISMTDTFADVREEMEQIGEIYRKIYELYGEELSITYLDPRNHFSIIAYLLRKWKAGSIRFPEMCKSLFFGIRRGAFFYNGHWINPDQSLDKQKILQNIQWIREKGGK